MAHGKGSGVAEGPARNDDTKLSVTISQMSGDTFIVELRSAEPCLDDLKAAIEAETDIVHYNQQLAFQDGSLVPNEDEQCLLSLLGLDDDVVLSLIFVPDLLRGYIDHVASDAFQEDALYGSWVLIARHFAQNGEWFPAALKGATTELTFGNPEDPLFLAMMKDYDEYRLPSGELAFRLSWPQETDSSGRPLLDQVWRQTASPVELPGTPQGYVGDRVPYPGRDQKKFWGLRRTRPDGSEAYETGHSLLHCQPGIPGENQGGWFWFTVGAPQGFGEGGRAFPGPLSSDWSAYVKHVELHIWKPHRSRI